ncbi:IS3 family transposase [Acinetobacter johnsonii]|uniref:IS3 family transposase n=1 Tax=Acinetobacter johnsonii TaxID=40214 RepID=UPI00399D2B62
MAKYSQEFKLEVVQYYLAGFGSRTTGKNFNVNSSDVEKWVESYRQHGGSGLSRLKTKRTFSFEFKCKVVEIVLGEYLSIREAAQRFNIKEKETVRQWLLLYKEHGIDGLKPKPKGRSKPVAKPIPKTKSSKVDQDKTHKELLEELEYLRVEVAFPKKAESLKTGARSTRTSRTAEIARLVSGLRQNYPLKYLLRAANMARSTYFYHQSKSDVDKHAHLKQQIREIYHLHRGCYGYRRITYALRNLGIVINYKCVLRLMQLMGLKSRIRAVKYRSYKGQIGKIADNVLQRQFKADKPNQKWATDVTEFNVNGEKLYLSPIIDLFNGEIIAFQTQRRPYYGLVKDMLDKAINRLKPDEKPILHSDQGWQYQMHRYQRQLKQHGLTQSMSRKGNCLDNAVIESFFATLKSECFHGEKFTSIDELEKTLKDYIHYYNHERIKVKLKGLPPVQYRNQSLNSA